SAAAVDVDALRLQELDANGSIPALREAAELYRGNLLEGFVSAVDGYDEWLAAERLRYWRVGVGVLGKLLAAQIRAGWWESAVETAGRLLSLDPTQEVVHRTLMRLQLDQGRADAALRRYQECAEILRREFGREPSAETEKVREAINAALEHSPAPRDGFLKPFAPSCSGASGTEARPSDRDHPPQRARRRAPQARTLRDARAGRAPAAPLRRLRLPLPRRLPQQPLPPRREVAARLDRHHDRDGDLCRGRVGRAG